MQLSADQLLAFGRNGFIVVRNFVDEQTLAEVTEEATSLVDRKPAPPGKVGAHHYFELPSTVPVADRALRESGVLS